MTLQADDPQSAGPVSERTLPWLILLFVGSGCAALIYEIIWFQLLTLVIGSSAVSLGALLGTFMGGMCLGSLLLPRVVSARRNPLRVYAALELGIGVIGVAVLFGMPLVGSTYSQLMGHGERGILLRGFVAAVCLLPPTFLMGATLPAIARSIETTREGVSWLGFFYGGNIAGAVFGCLLAGFYLLRVYDLEIATYVAAAINGGVAVFAFLLARWAPQRGPVPEPDAATVRTPATAWTAYLAIGLSGLCALGAEVVWTRLLSLLLGGTVYTFSIILAVFLVGLGIGSSLGSWFGRTSARPALALGVCQLLLGAAIAWTAWQLAESLPYWPIRPSLSTSPWYNLQLDLLRCLWAVLPAACLWGASFPLALASAASPGQDPGRLVGRVYAANTVGAIIGAVAFSIVLIVRVGTQDSQRLLMGLSALSGAVVLMPVVWVRSRGTGLNFARWFARSVAGTVAIAAAVALAAWGAQKIPEIPWELIAYGRNLPTELGRGMMVYRGEGRNSSVAVSVLWDGVRNFHVSGKIEASSEPQDMRLQRMLGHIPAIVHPHPKTVLVVGCGAGVTAGSFLVHPEVERVVICEIEPLIPKYVVQYFKDENYNVVNDPRVQVVYDDARHFILTTREKFDIITSDPIHPWMKGAATLYTEEYFELCKQHLNPGGILTQWVPLYESNPDAVKSELATLFKVFPEGTIWGNDARGQGYDVVLLAQNEPLRVDVDRLIERLNQNDHARVARSLNDVGFLSVFDLLGTYAGGAADLTPWLKDAQINHDRNLRLQYLAGMGLNSIREGAIYEDMLKHRTFPERLFVASERSRAELKRRLGAK
ncbi:MAG: fused MFS/spermidine synthase [Planctomycetia bacterium]|nr:fused MFS/spermidine synthase [Planctomycetia bacterium]